VAPFGDDELTPSSVEASVREVRWRPVILRSRRKRVAVRNNPALEPLTICTAKATAPRHIGTVTFTQMRGEVIAIRREAQVPRYSTGMGPIQVLRSLLDQGARWTRAAQAKGSRDSARRHAPRPRPSRAAPGWRAKRGRRSGQETFPLGVEAELGMGDYGQRDTYRYAEPFDGEQHEPMLHQPATVVRQPPNTPRSSMTPRPWVRQTCVYKLDPPLIRLIDTPLIGVSLNI